ncbi:MAG: hypothetical protein HYZ37_12285 [Candidatus Solibacter usitatus]|nr:hypothetical protein [Candidatus Solibacter usitatus]
MPRLGILFDPQKMGYGFIGYSAFRVFFSMVQPRDLAGCMLLHGEIGEGGERPYCIAIESQQVALLEMVRQMFARTPARGLLPPGERFLDDYELRDELALAATISRAGGLQDCSSKWLLEAWQRAVQQTSIAEITPGPSLQEARAIEVDDTATQARLPERLPIGVRVSLAMRRAIAVLLGLAAAWGLFPLLGPGLSIGALLLVSGLVIALGIAWHQWGESSLSSEEILEEAVLLLRKRGAAEAADALQIDVAKFSPLLRRLQSSALAGGVGPAQAVVSEHRAADEENALADARELRLHAFGGAACAVVSMAAMWVFQGTAAAMLELPRLTLAAVITWVALETCAVLVEIRWRRREADISRMIAAEWLPALEPKPQANEFATENPRLQMANRYLTAGAR